MKKTMLLALALMVTSIAGAQITGNLLWEKWNGSMSFAELSEAENPDETTVVYELGNQNNGDNYMSRITGYIIPQTTGKHVFYVGSDDNSEFWLSASSEKENLALMCSVDGHTSYFQFDKYPSQTSDSVFLLAGESYYFELLHQEGSGGDHAEVAWFQPGDQEGTKNIVGTEAISQTINDDTSLKNILDFRFRDMTYQAFYDVDRLNHTIDVDVAHGYDVTALTADILISPGATISPASGDPVDYTDPVTFTVTAADNSTQDYTVTVNQLPLQTDNMVTRFYLEPLGREAVIDHNANTITYSYFVGYDKQQTLTLDVSLYAEADLQDGSVFDVTNPPSSVTVTAQSGDERTYTIHANAIQGVQSYSDDFSTADDVSNWNNTGAYAFSHDAANERLELQMTRQDWADTDFSFPEMLNLYGQAKLRMRVTANKPVNKDGIQLGFVDADGNGNRDWRTNINKKVEVPNETQEFILDFTGKYEQHDHVEIGEITSLYFDVNRGNTSQGAGSDALIHIDDFRVGKAANANQAPSVDQPASPDWTYLSGGDQSVTLTGLDDGNPQREETITVSAVSSDQTVVKDEDITVDYDGTSETATISYSGTNMGFATITVYVQDDRGAVYSDEQDIDSVQFIAQFRDNSPGANNIATFDTPFVPDYLVGSGQNVIVVPNVDDGDEDEVQGIHFSWNNLNPELITIDSLVYEPGSSMALIYFTEQGAGGEAMVELSCQDSVDIDEGGDNIFSLTFPVSPSVIDNPGVNYGATDVQQWQPEPYNTNVVFKTGYPQVFPTADIRDHCKEDLFWGKMWGYIIPPETGSYQFISVTEGEGIGNFYLSTDNTSDNLPDTPTASNGSPSNAISLEASKPYYFEAYHKEIINTYQLTIKWSGPGFTDQILSPPHVVSALDLVKPTTPANLEIVAKGTDKAILQWDASEDNNDILGYVVLLDGYVYKDSVFTGTKVTLENLEMESDYHVTVMAVDEFNNYSMPTEILRLTTYGEDNTPPDAPGNVTVSDFTIFSATITWDEAVENETEIFGYYIYQDGSDTPLNDVPVQELTYTVTGLDADTPYGFTVTALDAASNESAPSQTANVTTKAFSWDDAGEEEMLGEVVVSLEPLTKSTGFAVEGGYHLGSILLSNKVSYNSFENENIKDFATGQDLDKISKKANGVSVYAETENPYDGDKSLKLVTSTDGYFRNHASITMSPQYTYLVKFAAKKDNDYSANSVNLRVFKSVGGVINAFQTTVTGLTTEWQEFTVEFPGIENASSAWWVEWSFGTGGTVYFDEVEMHIKDYYDPNSKFTTIGMEILEDLELAGLRWGAIGANYESLHNSSGPYQSNTMTYADFVHLSNQLGGYALICTGVHDGYYQDGDEIKQNEDAITDFFSDKNTFSDFMEYLGGDGSTEWGAKRIAEGYTNNLIEETSTLVIEFGNEVWGSVAHGAYTFGDDYEYYTEWANDVAGNYVKASPYYNPDKVITSISGRAPDADYGLHTKILSNPNAHLDWMNLSGYMGGNMDYEPNVDPGKTIMDYHKNGYSNFADKISGLESNRYRMLSETGRIWPFYFYEGNMTTQTYHGSLGQAITFGDYYAESMKHGVAIPSVFCLQGGQWRLIDDLPSLRKRPMYYVTRMYNHLAKGGVLLDTDVKSVDVIKDAEGTEIDLESLGAHAYANGDSYTVVLFSRDFENDYHAMINLPDDIGTITSGKRYTLSGTQPSASEVTIDTTDISVSDNMIVKVPKHSMVVLTFMADDKGLDAPLGYTGYDQVTSLELTTTDNKTEIDTYQGSLWVYAELLPESAFLDDVEWEITGDTDLADVSEFSDALQITAEGNGDGTLHIKATTVDGSNLTDEIDIVLSNQSNSTDNLEEAGIGLYPNPASNRLFIEIPGAEAEMTLFNMHGAALMQHELYQGKNEVDISALREGMYMIRMEIDGRVITDRFVKR